MAWLKRISRTPVDLIGTAILPLIAHTINHDVISIELYLLANSSETPSVCAMFHMTRMEMGCFRHKYAKSPFSCNFRIILYSVTWIFPIVAFDVIMSYNTIRNLYSLPWIYFNHNKQGQVTLDGVIHRWLFANQWRLCSNASNAKQHGSNLKYHEFMSSSLFDCSKITTNIQYCNILSDNKHKSFRICNKIYMEQTNSPGKTEYSKWYPIKWCYEIVRRRSAYSRMHVMQSIYFPYNW